MSLLFQPFTVFTAMLQSWCFLMSASHDLSIDSAEECAVLVIVVVVVPVVVPVVVAVA